jgi:UDP-N-acetylmuramoyl-L-alanyl-D-glutamate--2,6-diaminopimelate ligase
MTMPGRFKIQKFLRQAAEANCQYLVLEVTSEGIKQHRHQFIDFAVAVFTNLTPEHIEAHGGFERYREAKGKLFKATKDIHIINLDDENAEYFLRFPAHKKIGFTLNEMSREQFSTIKAKNIQVLQSGLKFFVDDTEFNLKLLGEFNIYNALAATCVALSQGVGLKTCKLALEKIEGIPGRMEMVISQPFKVFVDYAFTPTALEKVYQTIRNNFNPQKIICVLGACGGGRDKWKRPILGGLAAKYCDEVIITNEDPYGENPMEIINQVADGAGEKAKKFLDRRRAISEALKIAKEGDVIIITGKGCEPWICVTGGKKIPWDDRQVVKEEFRKIYEKV